jgi:hypothetical protein
VICAGLTKGGAAVASLQKVRNVYWPGANDKRVTKGTTGARKHTVLSTKWYGCWKEGDRSVRVPLCSDKTAAQVMLADLLRAGDRSKPRMIDPHRPHLDWAVTEHVNEYLESVTASGKVKLGKYSAEKRRC